MPSTNGHGPKRAVLYARVSGDKQRDHGYSLSDQKRELEEWAKKEGYDVLEVVEDGAWSGGDLARPGLDHVRDLVASGGVDAVVTLFRDRLARGVYAGLLAQEFAEQGCRLIALNAQVDDSPEGELHGSMLAIIAAWERNKIAERTRRGKLEKARQGKVIAGHTPPYGFRYNDSRENLVPDENQMRVVKRIFRGLCAGGSVFGISQTLMQEGVPAPAGGENWNHNTIRRIVLSGLYRPYPCDQVRAMVSREVAATLDPAKAYGIWWFNTKRTTRRYVSKAGPSGKEYVEQQRSRKKPREEWIAVPVPLDDTYGISRAVVDDAREAMRSRARHYKQSSRFWELTGGVLYCVHCGRRMSFANIKRRNGKRIAYYRCQGHRKNGHKEGCPNARHYRAQELEEKVWSFVHGLLSEPERLRAGLDAMIEEKRKAMRGDPEREGKIWLEKIAEVNRQRARAQDLAIEGLLSPDELRAKLADLKETHEAAKRELEALSSRQEEIEALERDRDALLESYAVMVLEGLDHYTPEDRRWAYRLIRLNVFADSDGSLSATWMFQRVGVIREDTHQDEGNAYLRLGEALRQLGREDEARIAYEKGIGQAEKFGHSGMIEDLRSALIELGR